MAVLIIPLVVPLFVNKRIKNIYSPFLYFLMEEIEKGRTIGKRQGRDRGKSGWVRKIVNSPNPTYMASYKMLPLQRLQNKTLRFVTRRK